MPQPIDPQTEIVRMSAAERIQQVADRASLAALQRVASDAAQEQVNRETQVQQTPEGQSEEVDTETRRRNPFAGRRHRRADTGADETSDESRVNPGELRVIPDGEERHNLDVSI